MVTRVTSRTPPGYSSTLSLFFMSLWVDTETVPHISKPTSSVTYLSRHQFIKHHIPGCLPEEAGGSDLHCAKRLHEAAKRLVAAPLRASERLSRGLGNWRQGPSEACLAHVHDASSCLTSKMTGCARPLGMMPA